MQITETYTNLGTLINAGTVQIDFEANFANSTIQNSGTLNLVGDVDFSQTTYTNDDNNSDNLSHNPPLAESDPPFMKKKKDT